MELVVVVVLVLVMMMYVVVPDFFNTFFLFPFLRSVNIQSAHSG